MSFKAKKEKEDLIVGRWMRYRVEMVIQAFLMAEKPYYFHNQPSPHHTFFSSICSPKLVGLLVGWFSK